VLRRGEKEQTRYTQSRGPYQSWEAWPRVQSCGKSQNKYCAVTLGEKGVSRKNCLSKGSEWWLANGKEREHRLLSERFVVRINGNVREPLTVRGRKTKRLSHHARATGRRTKGNLRGVGRIMGLKRTEGTLSYHISHINKRWDSRDSRREALPDLRNPDPPGLLPKGIENRREERAQKRVTGPEKGTNTHQNVAGAEMGGS